MKNSSICDKSKGYVLNTKNQMRIYKKREEYMNKKMIGISVCMLLISCVFGSVNAIESEKESVVNNLKHTQSFTLGETFLYPPWQYDSWYNEWSEGDGYTFYGIEEDAYQVIMNTIAGVVGSGSAQVDGHHYFQTRDYQYIPPIDALYDFTCYYRYFGNLEIVVFIDDPYDAYIYDKLDLNFSLTVWVDGVPNYYDKEVILDEDTRRYDHYIWFEDISEVSFNDIYVPEDAKISITTTMNQLLYSYSNGSSSTAIAAQIILVGLLEEIKIVGPKNPPNAPTITGSTSGKVGTPYTYKFTSTDPNGDDVSYYIKWGDGNVTDWTAFQAPGPPGYSESHTWDERGEYTIEAKAKDIFGAESDWATFDVKIERKSREVQQMLFYRLLEQFPILQKILCFIL